MPQSHQEIVRVMGRCDLHTSRSELGIHHVVLDDGDRPVHKRHEDGSTDEVAISLISGMHGNRDVAEDRFGPRRRNGDTEGCAIPPSRPPSAKG